HRQLRWAGAPGGAAVDALLDDAVLQRVVGDHHEAASGAEGGDGGVEPALEGAQLVVDRDAERLEDLAGRVAAPARRGRDGAGDGVRQLRGAGEGPAGDDGCGDAA